MEDGLSLCQALLCSQAEPLNRFGLILGNTFSVVVRNSEVDLLRRRSPTPHKQGKKGEREEEPHGTNLLPAR